MYALCQEMSVLVKAMWIDGILTTLKVNVKYSAIVGVTAMVITSKHWSSAKEFALIIKVSITKIKTICIQYNLLKNMLLKIFTSNN